MTDRELLELAAKAAELRVLPHLNSKNEWDHRNSDMYLVNEQGYPIRKWNPLTDDGDALRLAVKLGLTIHQWPDEVCVCDEKGTINEDVARVGDIYAATRRAIVRAAAEIGRSMK